MAIFISGKIQASLDENGHLHIKVTDYLYKVTLYEVPILAIVSELRSRIFDNNCDLADVIKRLSPKIKLSNVAGIKFSEFGTRRRFSYNVQDIVVSTIKEGSIYCTGTSNCHLAMKYDMPMMGTHPHEWFDSQTEPYVYAIVDDDRDMLSHQRKYFIKTNTVIGITDEDVRHIINILNRNDMWNDKLNAMIADSMKKHDTTRTNVYRAIKTAFTNYAAAKNAKPLDEAAEISIIKKMRDERWANAETYQTAGRMDLSAVEAEILEELLPKEPTKEELNAALLKLALDKGWYDDNEEHDIHPVQIPKNQMGIAVKELKAKYPAADGKKIADLVKANLCN